MHRLALLPVLSMLVEKCMDYVKGYMSVFIKITIVYNLIVYCIQDKRIMLHVYFMYADKTHLSPHLS